ncbi:hypothetical protein [Desulfovibrio aminophilus]|uniref:hypothetical protein n=1 Tax=Desulfovibrio aminophilus TaxID=81425 RepID=UPI00048A0CB7|nr:hypothetical protein [Desulfovibrio aminophilus]
MNLCADMMGDQPRDTFAIDGGQTLARIGKPFGKAVDPQPPVRVQHHLDHGGVFEQSRDCRPQCRAQHTCAACNGFRSLVIVGHVGPGFLGDATNDPRIGVD